MHPRSHDQGGLCPRGLCLGWSLSTGSLPGGSVQRRLCLGGSLCPVGVSVRGSLLGDPPLYGNEQAVRILLECILVFQCNHLHQLPHKHPHPGGPPPHTHIHYGDLCLSVSLSLDTSPDPPPPPTHTMEIPTHTPCWRPFHTHTHPAAPSLPLPHPSPYTHNGDPHAHPMLETQAHTHPACPLWSPTPISPQWQYGHTSLGVVWLRKVLVFMRILVGAIILIRWVLCYGSVFISFEHWDSRRALSVAPKLPVPLSSAENCHKFRKTTRPWGQTSMCRCVCCCVIRAQFTVFTWTYSKPMVVQFAIRNWSLN